jgi:hypothetical protein
MSFLHMKFLDQLSRIFLSRYFLARSIVSLYVEDPIGYFTVPYLYAKLLRPYLY